MDPLIGSALISAGASIFGGLFGGKKKQTTERTLNFQKIRDDGVAAGFNPLTALQAAAGAGVGTTVNTGPQLSTPEILANAIPGVAQAYADSWYNKQEDAKNQEIERIKLETMRAELDNVRARTSSLGRQQPFGASIPHYESDGSVIQTHGNGPNAIYRAHGTPGALERARDIEPVRNTPALSEFRSGVIGADPYWRPNPDAADMGISEGVMWGFNHGIPLFWDRAKSNYKNPKTPQGVAQKKIGDWGMNRLGDAKAWLKRRDDEFYEWTKSRAKDAYDYFSKPGRKSYPAFGPMP